MRAFALILLVFSAVVVAAEPLNVRGVELGNSEAEVLEAVPDAECKSESLGRAECTFTGYGPDLRAFVFVSLLDDRVYLAHVVFDQAHFSAVRDGLTLKFGAPQIDRGKSVTNAMGASFPSKELAWQPEPGRMLILIERAGRIDQSSVRLADVAGLKDAKIRRAADPKAAENL